MSEEDRRNFFVSMRRADERPPSLYFGSDPETEAELRKELAREDSLGYNGNWGLRDLLEEQARRRKIKKAKEEEEAKAKKTEEPLEIYRAMSLSQAMEPSEHDSEGGISIVKQDADAPKETTEGIGLVKIGQMATLKTEVFTGSAGVNTVESPVRGDAHCGCTML